MGLENYRRVLANEAFRQAEGNTARFMLFCLHVLLALSLCMAVLVRQSAHFQRWIKNGFLLPMAIPAASVVVFFRMLFDEKGWLNRTVRRTGSPPGGHSGCCPPAIFGKKLGYDMILWLAGLWAILKEQYEAAKVQGAWLLIFWRKGGGDG